MMAMMIIVMMMMTTTGVNLCTILLSWTSARLGLVEDARLMIIIEVYKCDPDDFDGDLDSDLGGDLDAEDE